MTAVLGGGISGLSAAYYALEIPKIAPLAIFEASNRIGGWIHSVKQSDGTIFEKGPRVIRANNYAILDLVEKLGLGPKVVPIRASHPAAKNRYIYADNTLHCLPNTIQGLVTKNSLLNRSITSALWKDVQTPKTTKDDESIYDFIGRRFGEDVSEKIVAPIFCGICGGDVHQLSIKSFLPWLFEAEQKHGSILMGSLKWRLSNMLERKKKLYSQLNTKIIQNKQLTVDNNTSTLVQRAKTEAWRIWGLRGGFEQLPQTIAENITKRGVTIKTKHNCQKLKFDKNGVQLTVNGNVEKYMHVISSLPAKKLANLVQEQHPELSNALNSIPTVTIALANLQFSENVLPLEAFGVLVPPKEEIPILGTLFDTCILPENSRMTVLTVMMGGAWFDKYFDKCSSEEHIKSVATKYVKEILNINEDPKACDVSILKDCIPQYTIGHTERLTRIQDYISAHKIPLDLCGSSYYGVGVSDVILSAKEAVSNITQCMK